MSTNIMALVNGNHSNQPTLDDDNCPTYDVAVNRSDSNVAGTEMSIISGMTSAHWADVYDPVPPLKSPSVHSGLVSTSVSRRPSGSDAGFKRYVYTYNMLAAQTPMQFYISVEPYDGKPTAGQYQFRLSMRVNGIERPLSESVTRHMSVDPRKLSFVVFVFPGKNAKQVLPLNSLWSLRVWLRVDGVDHQFFKVDDLLVGKDLDFHAIGDASFARRAGNGPDYQVYQGYVGKALITFTVRWQRIRDQLYKYSLEYEGGGVGDVLLNDLRMRIDGDPLAVSFLIYTIPVQSMPVGATHRMRVWLRSLVPLTTDPAISHPLPFNDSFIYQRIFKLDDFKVGGRLEFNALGNKLVMAFPHRGGPETITTARPPIKQDKEKEKEREERDRVREREKPATTPSSQRSHTYSNQNHGGLPPPPPPGAQYPAHMVSPQVTFSSQTYAPYHQQLPNPYPNGHMNQLQPVRATDRREHARSPPQVQKSKARVEII